MKKLKFTAFIFASVSALLLLGVACKKKENTETPSDPGTFDKQGMLVNYADKLIIPSYEDLNVSLDSLLQSYVQYNSAPTIADLQSVKQKIRVAYVKYQRISLFGLGPGEDQGIRTNFNVFPTSPSQIENNISKGSYDLSAISNIATKGFPALDYLFFTETEADLNQKMTTDLKRRKYADDLIKEMVMRLNIVISSWKSSYRNTFINSLGTDVGSSIGFLVNQINYELDYLKNAKLAIPLGLKSGGTILKDHCEAFYSGESMRYVVETFNTLENVYLGRSFKNEDGKGFDDYLEHLKIQHLETSLNQAIKNQFNISRQALAKIGNPLSEQVESNSTVVKAAHTELVKLLVLLKTDMPSSLGVVITYQDGDGD